MRPRARHVAGCEAAKRLEQPFLALAAAINDTLSSASRSPLEDRDFGSGLMLATDSPGHNSQPDVCGAGAPGVWGLAGAGCFVCWGVCGEPQNPPTARGRGALGCV